MMTFDQFIKWEAASKDTIDFKRVYAHMAGDALAGLMLSQIVFWHLPSDKTGETKLRVEKDGNLWMAVPREDWFEAICVTARQADRLISQLSETCQNDAGDTRLPLVEAKLFKFAGTPTPHIRLLHENFLTVLALCLDGQSFIQKHKPRGKGTLLISKVEDDNKTVKSTSLISKVASQISKVDLTKQESPLTETTNRDYTKTTKKRVAADAAEPTKSNPSRSSKQDRQDRILAEMIFDCTGWTFEEYKARMGNALDKALGAYRAYVKNIDEAGDPEPWLLMASMFRPGGWWYTDGSGTVNFSGQQGRRPTPAGIWKAWKAWEISQPGPALKVVNGNGHARAAPMSRTDRNRQILDEAMAEALGQSPPTGGAIVEGRVIRGHAS